MRYILTERMYLPQIGLSSIGTILLKWINFSASIEK